MAFRHIFIEKPAHIKTQNLQLILDQEDNQISVPIEDIATITLDCHDITITARCMSTLLAGGVVISWCSEKHQPVGLSLPYNINYSPLDKLKKQLSASIVLKKKIWQSIIKQKILNQSKVLSYFKKDKGSEELSSIAFMVQSGDTTNREGCAARAYFVELFGKNFCRDSPIVLNSCLNYGYAIVRSIICRQLVSLGLVTQLGIFHKNQYNPFNLADDCIEPFRPIVDKKIAELNLLSEITYLDSHTKKMIATILDERLIVNNQKMNISEAVRRLCESYFQAIEVKDANLILLPSI